MPFPQGWEPRSKPRAGTTTTSSLAGRSQRWYLCPTQILGRLAGPGGSEARHVAGRGMMQQAPGFESPLPPWDLGRLWEARARPGARTEPPLSSGGVCAERGPGQRSQSHRRCSGPRRAAWRLEVRMRPRLPAAGCCQAVRRIDRPLSALIPAQLTGYSERSSGLSKTPACSSPVTAIPPIRRSLCTPDNMVEIPYYAAFNNAFTRRRDMMF